MAVLRMTGETHRALGEALVRPDGKEAGRDTAVPGKPRRRVVSGPDDQAGGGVLSR